MDIPFRVFTLSTTFPTKVLDLEDPTSTLKAVGLAPSATVLVLPKAESGSGSYPSGAGGLWSLLLFMLTPIQALWNLIQSFLGLNNPTPAVTNRQQDEQARDAPQA